MICTTTSKSPNTQAFWLIYPSFLIKHSVSLVHVKLQGLSFCTLHMPSGSIHMLWNLGWHFAGGIWSSFGGMTWVDLSDPTHSSHVSKSSVTYDHGSVAYFWTHCLLLSFDMAQNCPVTTINHLMFDIWEDPGWPFLYPSMWESLKYLRGRYWAMINPFWASFLTRIHANLWSNELHKKRLIKERRGQC